MMGDYEDVFGAAEAAAALEGRIRALRASRTPPAPDTPPVLTPPLSDLRDHVEGPEWAGVEIVVFGDYGGAESRAVGVVLERLRDAHPALVRVAWRHFADPEANPRSTSLALAGEAAASIGRFWSMSRELLALHHYDLVDVQHAARQAGVDFDRLLWLVRSGVGADRIADDVASGLASSVARAPTLFVNGERYGGELDADPLWAATQAGAEA